VILAEIQMTGSQEEIDYTSKVFGAQGWNQNASAFYCLFTAFSLSFSCLKGTVQRDESGRK
jgi:hypothetical protein